MSDFKVSINEKNEVCDVEYDIDLRVGETPNTGFMEYCLEG